jgi:hypothetical protein
VNHYTSSHFWKNYNSLPVEIQNLASQNFELLQQNPNHPALQFKHVNQGRYRSVRVGLHYRALGIPVPDGVQWFWIGSHAEYDQILSKK